jgi:hypothetical protein
MSYTHVTAMLKSARSCISTVLVARHAILLNVSLFVNTHPQHAHATPVLMMCVYSYNKKVTKLIGTIARREIGAYKM